MKSDSLRAILAADEECARLQSLREGLVVALAALSGVLWLAAVWPARFATLQPVALWLWGAAGLATLVVIRRATACERRREQLMGLEPSD